MGRLALVLVFIGAKPYRCQFEQLGNCSNWQRTVMDSIRSNCSVRAAGLRPLRDPRGGQRGPQGRDVLALHGYTLCIATYTPQRSLKNELFQIVHFANEVAYSR